MPTDETKLRQARELLAAEYMQAATLPFITTVSTPGNYRKRVPFLDAWADDVSERLTAVRVIGILMRCEEGRALMQEMADAHGEWFAYDMLTEGEQ